MFSSLRPDGSSAPNRRFGWLRGVCLPRPQSRGKTGGTDSGGLQLPDRSWNGPGFANYSQYEIALDGAGNRSIKDSGDALPGALPFDTTPTPLASDGRPKPDAGSRREPAGVNAGLGGHEMARGSCSAGAFASSYLRAPPRDRLNQIRSLFDHSDAEIESCPGGRFQR
jgi:hypothetical protein